MANAFKQVNIILNHIFYFDLCLVILSGE